VLRSAFCLAPTTKSSQRSRARSEDILSATSSRSYLNCQAGATQRFRTRKLPDLARYRLKPRHSENPARVTEQLFRDLHRRGLKVGSSSLSNGYGSKGSCEK
jgi:hypothetical protein